MIYSSIEKLKTHGLYARKLRITEQKYE